MANTTLTDQFTIVVDSIADTAVHDITTTRAFRVVGGKAIINGSVSTAVSIMKVAPGGGATLITSDSNGTIQGNALVEGSSALSSTADLSIFGPNSTFLASDNLRVQIISPLGVPANAIQAIVLYCIGSPAAQWATT